MQQWWNDIFAGETEVLGENLPSATLSTTNPTWIDPGANPGLCSERPATNRVSHGTALLLCRISVEMLKGKHHSGELFVNVKVPLKN
jgi:hypothetical protein